MVEFVRMTLDEIMASGGRRVDHAKLDATTEEDIRQHMIEDGEDPDAPLPAYRRVVYVHVLRRQLNLSQEAFAQKIGVPVAMVRDWEQRRDDIDPAARALRLILEREPEAALRALAD